MMRFARVALAVLVAITTVGSAAAQSPPAPNPADRILSTIFPRHDQSKTLDEIDKELAATFTLRVPPARLREVNRTIEQTGWKAFRTELYPTYDLEEVARGLQEQARKGTP